MASNVDLAVGIMEGHVLGEDSSNSASAYDRRRRFSGYLSLASWRAARYPRTVRYPPIRTPEELAARVVLGTTVEDETLEFKAEIAFRAKQGNLALRKTQACETARDIVNLANSHGGTVLVGVAESEAGAGSSYRTAARYVPVEDAEALRAWLDSAPRQFMVPSTLNFTVTPIPLSGGGVVLAVNVPPYENGVAAIWHAGESNFVEYPYRTSFGKAYMTPDAVQERLMDRTRAMELRLRRLCAAMPSAVSLHSSFRRHRQETPDEATIRFSLIRAEGAPRSAISRQPQSVFENCPMVLVQVTAIGDSEFIIRFNVEKWVVSVPFGLIREVWSAEDEALGLMLAVTIVEPPDPKGTPWLDDGR